MNILWKRVLIGGATLLGGLCWMGSGLGIWTPSFIASNGSLPWLNILVRVAFAGAIVCVAIGLLGLRQLYIEALADKGQFGFVLAFAGLIVAASTTVIEQIVGFAHMPLLHVLQGFGLTLLSFGLIVIGGAALHHNQNKGWQLLPLVQGMLGLFLPIGAGIQGLPGFVAWVLFGVGWCWLGLIMVIERHIQSTPTVCVVVKH